MAGVLEICTEMLRGLLMPQNPERKNSLSSTVKEILGEGDLWSVVAALIGTISADFQSKSLGALHRALQQSRQCIASLERRLAALFKSARGHPVAAKLSQDVEALQEDVKAASCEAFRLKQGIHEEAIELSNLRRIEREAGLNARRLRVLRGKYWSVCDENRELNRTIQKLQGNVRVVCQIPTDLSGAYLEATNRGELTLMGKKKSRSFSVDHVLSGQPTQLNAERVLMPLVTSLLDGMDVMLVGMSTGEKSCFSEVMVHSMDMLLSAVEDRCFHAFHVLDFELSFITPNNAYQAMSRTNLTTALDGVKSPTMDRLEKIKAVVMELLSKRDQREINDCAHSVVKITAQTQRKFEDKGTTESTMTFVHLHPPSEGSWLEDQELDSVGSTLIEIASKSPHSIKQDSLVLQEILKPTGNSGVHMLFMELSNAPGHQKEDTSALNLCSRIMSSRMVDAKALARRKLAQRLETQISAKDQQISNLEQEKADLSHQSKALNSDIRQLQADIAALKAMKCTQKQHSRKNTSPHPTSPNKKATETSNFPFKQKTKNESAQRNGMQKGKKYGRSDDMSLDSSRRLHSTTKQSNGATHTPKILSKGLSSIRDIFKIQRGVKKKE